MQRHLRLRRSEDYARLRKTGRVWRHPFLTLRVASNSLAHNRYGFVTGRYLGKAVVRNRIRRCLREVVRRAHPSLKQGYDIVFIVRGPVARQPSRAINEAVITNLQRAGLWLPSQGKQL